MAKKPHLCFDIVGDTGKTKVWSIHPIGDFGKLGYVRWKSTWRTYVFEPNDDTVYSYDCLEEIYNFIIKELDKREQQEREKQ